MHARAFLRLSALLVAGALGVATSREAAATAAAKRGTVAHVIHAGGGARIFGRSIGSPTDGHLIGGVRLEDTPYLRIVPFYAAGDVRWGLGSLVSLLDHAGREVAREYPGSVLSVGHLSRPGGGDVDRHASHESGRDADVGFYVKGPPRKGEVEGKLLYSDHFVPFRGDGTAPSWPGARFDDARNWALVASILSFPHAHVSYLFVAAPLRARLLAYAAKIGAPPALRQRAAETMVQPRGSLPHDDHFHVRISCPVAMQGCIEFPTVPRIFMADGGKGRGRGRGPEARPRVASGRTPAKALPPVARNETPSPVRGKASSPTHESVDPHDLDESPAFREGRRAVDVAPLESLGDGTTTTPAESADSEATAPPAGVVAAPIDDVDGPMPDAP